MTSTQIRVRGMAELIATLPHQLGYRPVDSLVLVLLGPSDGGSATARPAGELLLMARIDLPHSAAAQEEILAVVAEVVQREHPAVIDLIAYEEDAHDATPVLRSLERWCLREGLAMDHLVRVRDHRWLSLALEGEPPGVWREVPSAAEVPATAELVLRGKAPGPSRAELVARMRGGDTARAQELVAELVDCLQRLVMALPEGAASGPADHPEVQSLDGLELPPRFLERAAMAWRRMLDPTEGSPAVADLPPAVLAQGLVLLEHRGFRDALIAWLAPGQLGPGMLSAEVMGALVRHLPVCRFRQPAVLDRLVAVCGLVPDEWAAPVLTVAAQAAWASHQGTLANIAIDRALEADPDYYLARLTEQLLRHAVRPPPGPFEEVA